MLGDNIRNCRELMNLSQSEAADKLGINRVNYNRYENNEREPDNEMLIKIADFFGVTVDHLLGRKKNLEQNTPKDLAKFLENTEVMFDGEVHHLDEEDKQKLKNALEFVFWQAKEKNKRKKQ